MRSAIILLLAALVATALSATDVVVKNQRLYVDGTEYFIKGVAYNPVPLGQSLMSASGTGGGGLCSTRLTPYSEYKSACFDSDYFDGSVQTTRVPPGPADGWFNAVWARDLPVIKSVGFNTVRLYNTNPITLQASRAQLGQNGISSPTGKDHVPFMNAAKSNGLKVIFPLIGDNTILTNTNDEDFGRLLRNQIDEVGNHDALLMYTFGNELNLAGDSTLVDKINRWVTYARNYQRQKHSRYIPITTAVVDLPESYNSLAATLAVDIFTTNAGYRGDDFQDLWSGGSGFAGWKALSCQQGTPLLLGEVGWHQINDNQDQADPQWINKQIAALWPHIDEGTIGGVFFEWSDEPLKAAADQRTMGLVRYTETKTGSTSSTQPNVWTPDTLERKPILFDAASKGQLDGTAWNYASDPFRLGANRSPSNVNDASIYDASCAVQPVLAQRSISDEPIATNPSGTNGTNTTTAPGNNESSAVTAVFSLAIISVLAAMLLMF